MCTNNKNKYYSKEDINNINNTTRYKLIIVNNKIYDISELIDIHPGGKDCLLKKIGQDCTRDLNFHTNKTKKLLKKLYVGKLKK